MLADDLIGIFRASRSSIGPRLALKLDHVEEVFARQLLELVLLSQELSMFHQYC
jgi:hypothetical protein